MSHRTLSGAIDLKSQDGKIVMLVIIKFSDKELLKEWLKDTSGIEDELGPDVGDMDICEDSRGDHLRRGNCSK